MFNKLNFDQYSSFLTLVWEGNLNLLIFTLILIVFQRIRSIKGATKGAGPQRRGALGPRLVCLKGNLVLEVRQFLRLHNFKPHNRETHQGKLFTSEQDKRVCTVYNWGIHLPMANANSKSKWNQQQQPQRRRQKPISVQTKLWLQWKFANENE